MSKLNVHSVITPEAKAEFNAFARANALLPIKVTNHYQALVEEEVETLGHTGGPLYRVVYPTKERLTTRVEHEVPDFVSDRSNMPDALKSVLIHKYGQRALFLVTDRCAGHCMYCFRQDVLSEMQHDEHTELTIRLNNVIAYLKRHPEVEEIILSGGDPLNVPFDVLVRVFERLKHETSVTDIRIHTRNVVFAPKVVSERVSELLGHYRARVYLHVVHPYEVVDDVVAVIKRLQRHGVRCYSQFPILRGINDHLAVLTALLRKLDDLDARPINLFIPDPIFYSASFRVSLKRLFGLMDELYWTTSSWTNGVRLVLDTPMGKVRREDVKAWDEQSGKVVFDREGKQIIYHDFPEALDVPGDPEVLLWKAGR